MVSVRNCVLLLLALCVLGLTTTETDAEEIARGIFFRLGEKLITELTPAGDTDTFVFYGVEGVEISLTLKARSGSIDPRMVLYDADMNLLNTAAYTRTKGSKVKLRKFPLPATGAYFVVVSDPFDRTGEYELRTKGKLTDVPPYENVTFTSGQTRDIHFGAGPGLRVSAKFKKTDRNMMFAVMSVSDPDGEEIPHAKESFVIINKGLTAKMLMRSPARSSWRDDSDPRRLGDYMIRVGGSAATTTLKVRVKVKHEKGSGTRYISPDIPVVTRVEPEFARPGADVVIHGANFQPGAVKVYFDDDAGRDATFVSPTQISIKTPYGEGVVDVTVINPDGQEGTLADAFTFIALPPIILMVTPEEGPDSGGTAVQVLGSRMTYVEKVSLGSTMLAGAPTVDSESQVTFVTGAMPAGTYDVTLTDKFGQTTTIDDAFTLVGAPALSGVSPDRGTYAGGDVIDCAGTNFRADTEVLVDGAAVDTTYVGPGLLRFTTEPSTPGEKIDVGVRGAWGRTSTIGDAFEYTDGKFTDVTSQAMPANASGRFAGGTAIAFGDIDGDNDPDAVIGRTDESSTTYQTWILKNAYPYGAMAENLPKPPSFQPPYPPTTGGPSGGMDSWQASDVALGDLDGDDDLDLVLTTPLVFKFSRSTYYWRSDPVLNYWTYRYYGSGIPEQSTRVLLNNGSGTFTHKADALPNPRGTWNGQWTSSPSKPSDFNPSGDPLQGVAISLGDIDNDGDKDLVLSHEEAIQKGTPTFYAYGYTTYTYTYYSYYWTYTYTYQVKTGTYSYTYPVPSLTYTFGIGYNYRVGWSWDESDESATRVFINDGSGVFTDATEQWMPDVGDGDLFAANDSALVDVNGDGYLDLVLTGNHDDLSDSSEDEYVAGSKTRVLINNKGGVASGKFTNETSTWMPSPISGDDWQGVALAIGDLDGMGEDDLVIVTPDDLSTGSTSLISTRLFSNSGSAFSNANAKLPSVRTDGNGEMFRAVSVVLVNANSDPALEIVIVDEAVVMEQDPATGLFTRQVSSTRVLRNDGSGGFTNDTTDAIALGADMLMGSAVALGDIDDDGDNDLLITTDLPAYGNNGDRPTRLYEFK